MRHPGKTAVIALALLAAGFFLAYLRFRSHLGDEATWTDGERHFASTAGEEMRYAVWDDPVPLSPAVNGEDWETRPALSPDGLRLVFCAGKPGLNQDLYVCEMSGGEPGPPEPLSLLNSPCDEIAPAFAGDALYFASNRPGGAGGFDLYVSRVRSGVFDLPEPAGGGLNSAADETDPAGLAGSGVLAFASNRGQRDFDLYLATPGPAPQDGASPEYAVAPLAAVNSLQDDREPALSADGAALLFASDREDGCGGFDLYRSVRDRGVFLPAKPVAGVNTPASERGPLPAADGFTLLFSAENAAGDFDLLRARSLELFRMPGRPIGWLDLTILAALLLAALLAWLAKRWESLDVLYRCYLLALVLHLLMLWYFQQVTVKGGAFDAPGGRDALFHVALARTRADGAAERELGGVLRAERAAAELAGPERAAAQPPVQGLEAAPLAAASRARPEAPPAPGRRPGEAPDRSAADGLPDVALADNGAPQERMAADAPALLLAVRDIGGAPERGAPAAPREPLPGVRAGAASGEQEARPDRPLVVRAQDGGQGPEAPAERAALAPSLPLQHARSLPALEDAESFAPLAQAPGEGSRVSEPLPSLPPATPGARSPKGPGPDRFGGETAPLPAGDALAGAPAPQGIGPRRAGALAESAPPRARGGAEPARAAGDLLDVALDDRPEGWEQDAATQNEPAAGAREGLALPAPRALDALPRRSESSSGPARLAFDQPLAPPSPRPGPALEIARAAPGEPDAELPRRLEHTPYRNRFGSEKQKAIELHGGSRETEKAVADGLAYLARLQNKDGFWGSQDDYEDKYGFVCVGKSGLCLLAFLGAGHTQASATEHSGVVGKALRFLREVQDEESGHFGWTSSYSHGIATYALAECYAMTRDEALRAPLERAVAEILKNQSQSRDARLGGGWGYYNPEGQHFDRWSRVSISAWQIMALESARLGGLAVEDVVFERAAAFLKNAYDARGGFYRYCHDPERLDSSYRTLPASTPAALFALSLLGDDIASREFARPRAFVLERSPAEYRCRGEEQFVEDASGNLYFWYYGSLALFRAGGEDWRRWNEAMKATLLPAQQRDGSWRPICPYSERACDTDQSRGYSTAMCVLALEVYYRYFTPLLRVK
ncbi:MAG: PD40 domain-containing protein [Planctomycetes bacterium]|nr:PD40 domain-containing protein [Planctomycetota bacterium]